MGKPLLLTIVLLVLAFAPLPQKTAEVRVASKKFTESVILGEMLRGLSESTGRNTVHLQELGLGDLAVVSRGGIIGCRISRPVSRSRWFAVAG